MSMISFHVHANGVDYNDIMIKQLEMISSDFIYKLKEQKVIILGDPLFVDVDAVNGVEVSKVVISSELVSDPKKRYFIAHLIRNILIHGAVIYNYDDQGNNFIMHPAIEVTEEFVFENRDLICDVIYYLLHKGYFNLYGNQGSSGEKFFSSPLLATINKEICQLKLKLMNENALMHIFIPLRSNLDE